MGKFRQGSYFWSLVFSLTWVAKFWERLCTGNIATNFWVKIPAVRVFPIQNSGRSGFFSMVFPASQTQHDSHFSWSEKSEYPRYIFPDCRISLSHFSGLPEKPWSIIWAAGITQVKILGCRKNPTQFFCSRKNGRCVEPKNKKRRKNGSRVPRFFRVKGCVNDWSFVALKDTVQSISESLTVTRAKWDTL